MHFSKLKKSTYNKSLEKKNSSAKWAHLFFCLSASASFISERERNSATERERKISERVGVWL